MSEEQKTEVNVEELQKELATKNEMLQNMQQQVDALKNKTNELLDETKKAKDVARQQAQAEYEEELKAAKEKGNYEQLFNSSEKERKALSDELQKLQQSVSSERVRNESMKLAAELADGSNAELLSEFIVRRLKYTDEGIKVVDKDGNLTVSSIGDLKREFESSNRYQSLLRGNKSSGGGAVGSGGGASGAQQITRDQFDAMNPAQQMQFAKDNGQIVEK